jgi:hypothetical protein
MTRAGAGAATRAEQDRNGAEDGRDARMRGMPAVHGKICRLRDRELSGRLTTARQRINPRAALRR